MIDASNAVRSVPNGCVLLTRVHPGARSDAVTGLHAGAVKIALRAPAVDGRANDALIAFIAEKTGVPRVRVTLVSGVSNRSKALRITGKTAQEVWMALFPEVRC